MEIIKNFYESMFIVDVTDGEDAVKASVEKFVGLINANSETVYEVNEWGKRRLAYPINDKPEGYYVVVTFKADPEFPAEFERLANIDESILRSMVIRLENEPTVKVAEPATEETAPAVEEAPVEETAPATDAE
ncbi:MAG: 30S ribosomal protein S6 [Clostridia bacterium]|jgi:small subunit ribosomal protein S6|nr:30S ribosomal protein S6 [Clostridia bacterium]MBQ7911453.1 30S ribosomal protein S6 [Clostridia bacterium]